MRLEVLAIGRWRGGATRELWDDYAGRIARIGPGLGFRGFSLREFPESKGARAEERMAGEARTLLDAAGGAAIVALDERGRDLSSAEFARLLASWRDEGTAGTAFVIGGADGLDPGVRDAARLTLRFGRQTWPHLLVRALLAEQVYRAMTILSGHPYHRA